MGTAPVAPKIFNKQELVDIGTFDAAKNSIDLQGHATGKPAGFVHWLRKILSVLTLGRVSKNPQLDQATQKAINSAKYIFSKEGFTEADRTALLKTFENLSKMNKNYGGVSLEKVEKVKARLATQQSLGAYNLAKDLLAGAIPGKDATEFLKRAQAIYPEIDMYAGEVDISPSALDQKQPDPKNEAMRTKLSFACFFYLMTKNYAKFTENHKPPMSKDEFDAKAEEFRRFCHNPDMVNLMLTTMAVHDLGKVKAFANLVREVSGKKDEYNHDTILRLALENINKDTKGADGKTLADWLPSYARLPAHLQEKILHAWKSDFNGPQLIQGENLAANLESYMKMKKQDPVAAENFRLHDILDMGGTVGFNPYSVDKKDNDGNVVKDSKGEVVKEMKDGFATKGPILLDKDHYFAIECFNKALATSNTPKEAYAKYFTLRGERLFGKNFNLGNAAETQAILRLCCMNRYYDKAQGELVKNAFNALPADIKANLTNELGRSGFENDQKALLLYYAPALVQGHRNAHIATIVDPKADDATKKAQQEKVNQETVEALKTAFVLLDHLYKEIRTNANLEKSAGVYELNVHAVVGAVQPKGALVNVCATAEGIQKLKFESDFNIGKVTKVSAAA